MSECTEKDRIAAIEKDIKNLCTFRGETESDVKTIFIFMRDINKNLNRLMFTIYGSIAIAVLSGTGIMIVKSFTKVAAAGQ